MKKIWLVLIVPFLACGVLTPAAQEQEPNTEELAPDAGPPAPNLVVTEVTATDIIVRPGQRAIPAFSFTLSSEEDIDATGFGIFVNRGDGANLRAGDTALSGRLTISNSTEIVVDIDAMANEPFGNAEKCEVINGVVTKGPCYFTTGSQYLREPATPVRVTKDAPVTLTVSLDSNWRASNADSYRVYMKIMTYKRPSEENSYQALFLPGYRGPVIQVEDTTSFCDLREFGLYGSQGCCDARGFQTQANVGAGALVTVPFMKTVFAGMDDNTLARFPSSRELASWYGRANADGMADLNDHAVCNLVRSVSVTDLLGLDATATVGLKPGEYVVRTWSDEQLYVIDRHKTLRKSSLETALLIYGELLDDRILFMTEDDLGTPGQPGSYNLGADVLAAADFDPVAASAAAVFEEETN